MIKINVLPSTEELIRSAGEIFIDSASGAIKSQGTFSVALSGGNTPLPLYEYLAHESDRTNLDWQKVHFFWGDERTVPPDHPDSNFFQANQALLQPRSIPETNIHRIRGELDPNTAALNYQEKIHTYFKDPPLARFDLILLGLGSDGHTASIFPGTDVFNSPQDFDLVAANHVPQLDTWRITFTTKLINAAKCILFLVSGQSKADVLREVLESLDRNRYPAQTIRPTDGELIWLVDPMAGELLSPSDQLRDT